MANLEIFVLNVGQADTTVIKTPGGKVIVIDAVKPQKTDDVLNMAGINGGIYHLLITHPHYDHYSAASYLAGNYSVEKVTLAPFWFEGTGTPAYHTLINRLNDNQVPVRFVSGYERLFPDGGTFPDYEDCLYLEVLGPTNSVLKDLDDADVINPNHLSIMTKLVFRKFAMVSAGDAQMENWAHFDREGMLDEKCDVLKVAHHGSKRGSQWERIERLNPKKVIVSSDPDSGHYLPDAIGSVIFDQYNRKSGRDVYLTRDSGTLKIEVINPATGRFTVTAYNDTVDELVSGRNPAEPDETDWNQLARDRIEGD
jgi:competence protein ComEC